MTLRVGSIRWAITALCDCINAVYSPTAPSSANCLCQHTSRSKCVQLACEVLRICFGRGGIHYDERTVKMIGQYLQGQSIAAVDEL